MCYHRRALPPPAGTSMKAEIISIGTELLLGEIVDLNSPYLAGELPKLGIDVYHIQSIGDNMDRLLDSLRRSMERSDLVLMTGGLGPTDDDLTRAAVARLLGEELYVDPELEAQVRGFFGNRGINMPENNIKQAMLIPSASAIPNPMGTAPGWWTQKDGKILVSMPGPPRELRHMWENQVRPRLRDMVGGGLLTSRTLKITGISEGGVDEMCGDLLKAANPSIGVYARPDGIHVRLAAKAMTEAEADALIGPVEAALRDRFGEHVWGVDDETMEEHVGKLLTERGLTLATMESLTGGMLGDTITNVPGSSRYYRGGIVAYQTELKIKYGVPRETIEQHGAVSEETAIEMAQAARRELGADVGIGVTGVAGPTEQEGRPVGTVYMAVANAEKHATHYGQYPGRRGDIKRRVVTNALFYARMLILGKEAPQYRR